MSLMFLLVVVVIVVISVVRVLPLMLLLMMISTIQRFVFYMPLLAVRVMTHSYAFGPIYYRNGKYHILCLSHFILITQNFLLSWRSHVAALDRESKELAKSREATRSPPSSSW